MLPFDSLLESLRGVAMVVFGLVVIMACLAVMVSSRRRELSLRTVAALTTGLWAGMAIANGLTSGVDPFAYSDLVGVVGVGLWAINAAITHHGKPIRRATDWGALDGQEAATKHAPL